MKKRKQEGQHTTDYNLLQMIAPVFVNQWKHLDLPQLWVDIFGFYGNSLAVSGYVGVYELGSRNEHRAADPAGKKEYWHKDTVYCSIK